MASIASLALLPLLPLLGPWAFPFWLASVAAVMWRVYQCKVTIDEAGDCPIVCVRNPVRSHRLMVDGCVADFRTVAGQRVLHFSSSTADVTAWGVIVIFPFWTRSVDELRQLRRELEAIGIECRWDL